MYTVAELIETLKQCPQDYEVVISVRERIYYDIDITAIDHEDKTINLIST